MSANTIDALNAVASRRSFLKMSALAGVFGATSAFANSGVTRAATEEEIKNPFPGSKIVKTFVQFVLLVVVLKQRFIMVCG